MRIEITQDDEAVFLLSDGSEVTAKIIMIDSHDTLHIEFPPSSKIKMSTPDHPKMLCDSTFDLERLV